MKYPDLSLPAKVFYLSWMPLRLVSIKEKLKSVFEVFKLEDFVDLMQSF